MGGWIVKCDGETVEIPLDVEWMVPTLSGTLPDEVMLEMDEDRFKRDFAKGAISIMGRGEFASLSYCPPGLTIYRYKTEQEAISAKRTIDHSACGNNCCRVHLLVRVDPTNSRKAKELENVRRYRDQTKTKATQAKKD